MFNNKVNLYIDDTSIRLMVTQGQKVKKWADVQLDPGLVKDGLIEQEAEVATKIRNLLKSQKVRARKVTVGFSGLHTLTRPVTLPQLPKAMLPEAVAREARRVLPVALDQLYLSWRVIPGAKGRIQVFIAALPRRNADAMVKVLRAAGLDPSRMAIKPLALTKILPYNTAVMIDVQPNEFDVVIMVDGVAQPIRTVTFPNQEITPEQKLSMIISDLDRTIKFYDTNNQEKPLDITIPIYVSGGLLNNPEVQKQLAAASAHPVKPLVPVFKGLDQVDLARYMINIAMVTNPTSAERETTFPVANMNLLPAPYMPKSISVTQLVGVPVGLALAGLIVPLVITLQNTNASIISAQEQLTKTNTDVNKKTKEKTELVSSIKTLEQSLADANMVNKKLDDSNKYLTLRQNNINTDIKLSLEKLPSGIKLLSISQSVEALVIMGTAPSEKDINAYAQAILQYARSMDSSKKDDQSTKQYEQSVISSISVQGAIEKDSSHTQEIAFTLTFERGE